MAVSPSLDELLLIFPKDVYQPSPTYNDLTLLTAATKDAIGTGGGGGAGSGEIIDCGARLTGSEITDLGSRI